MKQKTNRLRAIALLAYTLTIGCSPTKTQAQVRDEGRPCEFLDEAWDVAFIALLPDGSEALPQSDEEKRLGISFGANFEKKVRKHIDQVRNRYPDRKQSIPSPSQGGTMLIRQIIIERVKQGRGRKSHFTGEPCIVYEDEGVSYLFRMNGEFWTILSNKK